MRARIPLLLTASLCLGTATAVAAAPAASTNASAAAANAQWYSVEVLVFRYTGPNAAQGELWPRTVAEPSLAKAVYPPAGTDPDYRVLARPSATIAQAQQRLAETDGYDPVTEIGWIQPGLDPATTRPVSLHPLPPPATALGAATAMGAATAITPATTATPAVTAASPLSAPAAASTLPPAVRVEGTATLAIAANKPYVQLDLRLCEPAPPGLELQAPAMNTAAAPATAAASTASAALSPVLFTAPAPASSVSAAPSRQCFALRESHQVTPGQMEYFDTSAFGVLALVHPVATPPAATATGPRAANTPH